MSIAFLYPKYPASVGEFISKPYKLSPVVYEPANVVSFPINLTISGLKPSSPPWKGTVNFNWLAVGPVDPSVDIEALNEPVHKLELAWPL